MSHPPNTVPAHAHHQIPAGRTARRGGLGRWGAEPRPRRRQRRACGPLLLPRPSEVQLGPVPRVRVVPRADLLHRSEDGQTALRRPRRGQNRVRDRHRCHHRPHREGPRCTASRDQPRGGDRGRTLQGGVRRRGGDRVGPACVPGSQGPGVALQAVPARRRNTARNACHHRIGQLLRAGLLGTPARDAGDV